MQMRMFGRTGMQLSVLGFGCGAVGGSWCAAILPTRSAPWRGRSPPA